MGRLYYEIQKAEKVKLARLDQKFKKLLHNPEKFIQHFSSFHYSYLNLTIYIFTQKEERMLTQGPKYVPQYRIDYQGYISELADAILNAEENQRDEIRSLICSKL